MHGSNEPALYKISVLIAFISCYTTLISSTATISAVNMTTQQLLCIFLSYICLILSPWFCISVIFSIYELSFHQDFTVGSTYQNIRQLYLNWTFDFRTTDNMPGAYNQNENEDSPSDDFTLITSRRRRKHKNKTRTQWNRKQQKKSDEAKSQSNSKHCNSFACNKEQQPKQGIDKLKESKKQNDMHATKNDTTSPKKWTELAITDINKMEDNELESLFQNMKRTNRSSYHRRQKQSNTCAASPSIRSKASAAASMAPYGTIALSWSDIVKNNYNRSTITDSRKQSVSTESSLNSEVPALTDNESTASSGEELSPKLSAPESSSLSLHHHPTSATAAPSTATTSKRTYSPFETGFDFAICFTHSMSVEDDVNPFRLYHTVDNYLLRPTQYIPSVHDIIHYTPPLNSNTVSTCNSSNYSQGVLDLLNASALNKITNSEKMGVSLDDDAGPLHKGFFDFLDQQDKEMNIDSITNTINSNNSWNRRNRNRVFNRT